MVGWANLQIAVDDVMAVAELKPSENLQHALTTRKGEVASMRANLMQRRAWATLKRPKTFCVDPIWIQYGVNT